MTQPAVTLTTLDNQLGVVPPNARRPILVVGVSSTGTKNFPTSAASVKTITDAFGDGPMPEAAAIHCKENGTRVVCVRTEQTVDGSFLDEVEAEDGTVENFVDGVTGSSNASVAVSPAPDPSVAADRAIVFIVGGTRGTVGIVYQKYLNGLPDGIGVALGTATSITIDGVQIDLSAGTVVESDTITWSTTAPIEASAGELVVDFAGSSVPTINATPLPIDDYEVKVKFVVGGTRGTTGIVYQYSLDGGRNYSAKVALGTATNFTIPGAGRINLGAGTIVAGDTLEYPTVAPQWNQSDLIAALDAAKVYGGDFEIIQIVGPMSAANVAAVTSAVNGMISVGKNRVWIGSTRLPVGSESEATYAASLTSEFTSSSSLNGSMCAGACEFASAISGRQYRRPAMFQIALREAAIEPSVNAADSGLPALNCTITDSLGNPKHHDETMNPGLDDLRFSVLRTIAGGPPGVFVNISHGFAPEGSDFDLFTYMRVILIARDTLNLYFGRRLNMRVSSDTKTGYLSAVDREEIELGAENAMVSAGLRGRHAVNCLFTLSPDDNVLSTRTGTGRARVQPFGYMQFWDIDVGLYNPALAA